MTVNTQYPHKSQGEKQQHVIITKRDGHTLHPFVITKALILCFHVSSAKEREQRFAWNDYIYQNFFFQRHFLIYIKDYKSEMMQNNQTQGFTAQIMLEKCWGNKLS